MTEDSALPHVGDIVGGKYRIEQQLGAGGMSAVFEAKHLLTDRRFAIKWLLPELASRADGVRRFVREAKVAGRVDHPNVVEIYDFGEAEDSFYMVMELLEGEPLDLRLQRVGKFSPAEACRILLPCMRGVARAHAAGVIHRDLKPGNIFLCAPTDERPELPKVLDFGISRVADVEVTRDSPITESGMWMGTPHYMSPEQVRGREVDHRADVYAFGVILYELLSGELPFFSDTLNELMVKVAAEDPVLLRERLPDLDPELAKIVHRAMARVPAMRFPDLDALVRALAPFAPGEGPQRSELHATPSSPSVAVGGRASALRRHRGLVLGAATVLSMGLAAWLLAPFGAQRAHEAAVASSGIVSDRPAVAVGAPAQAPAPQPQQPLEAVAANRPNPPPDALEPSAGASGPSAAHPAPHARKRDSRNAAAPDEVPHAAPEFVPSGANAAETAAPLIAASEGQRTNRGAQSAGSQRASKASNDAAPARRNAGADAKAESLSGVTFDMADFIPRAERAKARAQAAGSR